MIGGEDDDGVLLQACRFQSRQDPSELIVHPGDLGEVVLDVAPGVLGAFGVLLQVHAGPIDEIVRGRVSIHLHVPLRHPPVRCVRWIHRHHQSPRLVRVPVPAALVSDEADRLVGFVLRSPLVHRRPLRAGRVGGPVLGPIVVVVRPVGVPVVESVAAVGRGPFVPGEVLRVVGGVHVGTVRGVQVPLPDVAQGVSVLFEHVGPAASVL